MTEEENEPQGIKVQDKRRFDQEGNVRESAEEESSHSVSEAKRPQPQSSAHSYSHASHEPPSIDFAGFAISLATQALMQLGAMPAPDGVEVPVNRAAAKQTIDILNMLHEKTTGNLTTEEDKMMGEILHNLRLTYLSQSSSS